MSFDVPRLLLPTSLLLLAACASDNRTPSSVVLGDDHRCPQTLHTGQQLIVSLPSNPATGYRWLLREAAAEQLRSLGPEVYSNPNDDVIGGDGLYLALRGAEARQWSPLPHLSTPVGGGRRAGRAVRLSDRGTLKRGQRAAFRYNAAPFSSTPPPT